MKRIFSFLVMTIALSTLLISCESGGGGGTSGGTSGGGSGTAPKAWGTPTLIESNTGDARAPQIAIDPKGNAIAVWMQRDGTSYSIYANRYVPNIGWGTATLIESNTGDASFPQIAIDPKGNAIAVWTQWDGSYFSISIYANRYVSGWGWGTATLIESNTGDAIFPQIAIDPKGNVIAVWMHWDGSFYSIYANRYVPNIGWGTATLIESNTGDAHLPQIAIDQSGNAIAVWWQYDGTYYSIYANRFE